MTHNQNPEITQCENCGGRHFDLAFSGGDKLLGVEGNFNILKCQNCGIYLLSPKISSEEMEKYYPEDYICYQEAIEDDENLFSRLDRENAFRKRCKIVTNRIKEPGTILDVGCATGLFLNEMKKLGWTVKGVEPNKNAANYAERRFGLDVFCGYLNEANLPDETYDVITLWDVLEHVPDAHQLMDEIYRLLKPGGLIIATLPNGEAWERYIFGEYWVGWEIPRHYRTHTPTTITNFLKEKSFDDIHIFSFIGRHGAFMLSVQFFLNTWQAADWKKKFIKGLLGSLPFRILTHPLFLIAEVFNRSNIMSFSANKPTRN